MQIRYLNIILLLLLLTACSEKTPRIDGQKNKFINKFFPAIVDPLYSRGDVTKQKYPIIFLFDGYEGIWENNYRIKKLQKMGYHVVSFAYFDDAGYSNNLAKVNINDIKKIMDRYKHYSAVDTKSIGVLGRGKGAELALLLASYYPDIKMVVGISPSNVVFQAGRATLATESSWVYNGEEVAFVPYPKLSFSAIKSFYRVIVHNDNYRDLHDLAIEDKEAVDKARIKVENINGDIFLTSVDNDKLWNSELMSSEIIKQLKEKNFPHYYEHKSYKGDFFLNGEDEESAWEDVYNFILNSLESKYLHNIFSSIDKNMDKLLSMEEYFLYDKERMDDLIKRRVVAMMRKCDKNHNQKIDYFETHIDVFYNSDSPVIIPDMTHDNTPIFKNSCMVAQSEFKKKDLNSDMSISVEELHKSFMKREVHTPTARDIEMHRNYRKDEAKKRFGQCDENNDSKISKKEARVIKCKIDDSIFELADINKNSSVSLNELTSIPTKYARFRQFIYIPKDNKNLVYADSYYYPSLIEISMHMNECDKNYDSKLDKAEATNKACGFTEQEFLDADIDKNGFFSYKDKKLSAKTKRFKNADKDSSGGLNFLEWVAFDRIVFYSSI